ncbi:hypothetical protein [Phaeobacter sp. CAU 1743]|uniref:hypothetical protein n=1 Tax=Rhodobacterales TaxID=204455 RepID=UPI0023B679CA
MELTVIVPAWFFVLFGGLFFQFLVGGVVLDAEVRDGAYLFEMRGSDEPNFWQPTNWFMFWWWKANLYVGISCVSYVALRYLISWLTAPGDEGA